LAAVATLDEQQAHTS